MVGASAEGQELNITVLGRVGATRGGREIDLQPGQRQLLALLVAVGAGGADIHWLADEIWGESQPNRWQESLRMAVSRLRKRLGLEIKARNGRYRLGLAEPAVDAWHLLQLDQAAPDWDPALEPYVSSAAVFPGVELSAGLLRAKSELVAAQRSAIEKLSQRPELAPGPLLPALARHLDDDLLDENLCFAVALIHAANRRRDHALAMIERCIGARRDTLGREPAPQLLALQRDVVEHRLPDRTATAAPTREIRPPAVTPVERFRAPHFVGRQAELQALSTALDPQRPAVVVVRGRPASGKTALLAELTARAVEQGAYVVWIAGRSGERVGLAPFTGALPRFRAAVAGGDHLEVDALARRSLLAAQLSEVLDREALGRPVVLVVDDAHWLDSMSCDLVDFMAHWAGTGPVSVVLAARRAEQHDPWTELQTSLDRLPHVISLDLAPLSELELAELVTRCRPETGFANQAQLTRWLHQTSGGLPGVVAVMLDGEGDRLDAPDMAPIFDRLLEPLDPATRRVGAAAAVLGARFQVADLALLLDRDEASLDDPLEELVQRELLAETGAMGRFEFTHQLVADAFLRSSLSTRRARLHLAASRLTTSVHQLARHKLAAGALVDVHQRRAAALTSARQHLANGAFFEAVTAFRAAAGAGADDEETGGNGASSDGTGIGGGILDPGLDAGAGHEPAGEDVDGLDTASLVEFATALALAGLRVQATVIRARAYHRAAAEDRWDLALDAAASGLPEAEVEDGECDRLEQLEHIDPARLDAARQLTQALLAARQAAMLGDLDQAGRWAERASELATADEDRAQAALARRFVDATLAPPAQRHQRVADTVDGLTLTPRSRCRLAQFAAIDHIEQGATAAARNALDEFEELARQTNDALRQWHALIFRAMLHDTDGDWTEADRLADAALALGRRHGMAQAGIVRLSQHFFRLRVAGGLAQLAPGIDAVPEPDGGSLLFSSARATILDAADEHRDAGVEALQIARRTLERPSAAGLSCLAMVAPLVGRHGPPSLRAAARAALAPFEGSALIVGAGLGNLGPVDFLLSSLDRPTGRQLERALRRSMTLADRFDLRSWSIRYRLDLAVASGSGEHLEQARALAHGTALEAVVEASAGSGRPTGTVSPQTA